MPTPSLRKKLESKEIVIAPGVFDMMSLLIAEQKEFPALFFSGYWGMASHLGVPDAGIATYRDFITQISKICAATQTPIIADADTGFGGLLNIDHTVRGYEAAGVSAIQIEDQVSEKRCGHQPGKQVVTQKEMVDRIQVAIDARRSEDFLIIARTDAIAVEGLASAISRGQIYREAGADIIFVEAPISESDMRKICAEIDGPKMINLAHGGHTPILSKAVLQDIGYALAIIPAAPALAALKAMDAVYDEIKVGGTAENERDDLYDFNRFSDLIGFADIREFENKWSRK